MVRTTVRAMVRTVGRTTERMAGWTIGNAGKGLGELWP